MTASIISLITLGLGLLFWWLRRRAAAQEDPLEKNRQRYEQINTDIVRALASESVAASHSAAAHGSDDLDELDRLQRSHSHERQ